MRTANDGTLKCVGTGYLVLNSNLTIRNVLYCPDVSMNLTSASQICDQGFSIECTKSATYVKKGQEFFFNKKKRKQYLYVFQMLTFYGLSVSNKTELTLLFHRRMGHLNLKSLRLLSHLSEGIILDKDPSTFCEVFSTS
jgi:hypothetical protein